MDSNRLLTYIPEDITERSSVIYFVQGSSGLIKIGRSKRFNRRIRDLMTENDRPVVLVGVIVGELDLKHYIHKKFKEHRWHGEWFYPADELTKFIKENRDPRVKKILETIRDVGPGRKEAEARIVDLDFPIREKDCGIAELSRSAIQIPVGRPGMGVQLPEKEPA